MESKKKRLASIEYTSFVWSLNASKRWNVLKRTLPCHLMEQISSSQTAISSIKQEIERFEEIRLQLTDDLANLQAVQKRLEYSRTFKGRYFHVLGHFFSLYCIWKIFISFVNIVFNRVGKGKIIYESENECMSCS